MNSKGPGTRIICPKPTLIISPKPTPGGTYMDGRQEECA
jgi:hypothetical protein